MQMQASSLENVCQAFVRQCKKRKASFKVADSTGVRLTGGQLLMRTLILRRLLRRHVLRDDEQYVGLLLPPSAGGVLANIAVSLDHRVVVNLNYTLSSDTLAGCIAECGIKHVLTSRKFMERMSFDLPAELVYLEDLKEKTQLGDVVAGFTGAYAMPAGLLERSLGLQEIEADDVLTVIFTSGSTGKPKGVMLTHANIASQVDVINQVVRLGSSDVLTGIVPFFHSLGYTVTLWCVAGLDIGGAYHFSPLEAQQVGQLVRENQCTILLATPTFLRNYLSRCTEKDFASLEVVVTGAERLTAKLCQAFEEKYGVRPVEGYGATELSPLVAVNVPPSRSRHGDRVSYKEGTVGRSVPGVRTKVTAIESDMELNAGEEGMLWVTGPNVMKGYFSQPEATADVMRDGWYRTGDVAVMDSDGFIKITGRVSRFSKIGGEMVPHVAIEDALNTLIGTGEEGLKVVVTSAPDEKRGERLVVIHTRIDEDPAELCTALQHMGLPNLFIPSANSFVKVDELPLLGSGKLDLKAVEAIACARFGRSGS